MVMFFRRRQYPESNWAWKQMVVTDETGQAIKSILGSIQIPLELIVRGWTSMHYNRSLEVHQRGASVELLWDNGDSNLGDALRPLTSAIADLVALAKVELEKYDLTGVGADEAF